MRIFIIFFLFLVFSCTGNKDTKVEKINFNENITFDEFKIKIINYGKNSDFPNINE